MTKQSNKSSKKPTKKSHKKIVRKSSQQAHLWQTILSIRYIGLVMIVLVGCLFMYFSYFSQFKPVIESPKTEQKKIPEKLKDKLGVASAEASLRVPILMYHYVEYVTDLKDTMRQKLNINPSLFESQIKTLSDAHYTFMTASDLGMVLDGKKSLPPKPILITIDDGHWDVDTVILPILKKYHAKATAYVIPGLTGGSDFMSQDQVTDIIKSGQIEVGAHTVHHVGLKGKYLPIVKSEVEGSKKMLENTYHIKVVSFAYPNGEFDEQAVKIVRDAGFSTSVSTVPGITASPANRFFLFRLRPGGRTGDVLLNYLEQPTFNPFGSNLIATKGINSKFEVRSSKEIKN